MEVVGTKEDMEKYRDRDFLREQYLVKRRSMQEIADDLGVNPKKIQYWMTRYDIKRRNRSDATYWKHNPDGEPFKIKELKTVADSQLFYLGLGLYIGEGRKKGSLVALGNTDPRVIVVFLNFLFSICGVPKEEIKAEINIYDDVPLKEAAKYWGKVTQLSRKQFYAPQVRKSRGGTYKKKSQYGTLTIYVLDSRLRNIILAWCDEYLLRFARLDKANVAQSAEHVHGKHGVTGSIPVVGSKICLTANLENRE